MKESVWYILQNTDEDGYQERYFEGTKDELLKNLEWTCRGFVRGRKDDIEFSCIEKDDKHIYAGAKTKEGVEPKSSMVLSAVDVTAMIPLCVITKEEYERNDEEMAKMSE